MTTYVVRFQKSQEFVGIYSASKESEIFWLVDQLCDPYACEYAKLNFGGIGFAGKCSRFVSSDKQTNEEIDYGTELNDPEFTEEMLDFKGRWKKITEDCYD